jgi:post-segregation antitoxin (ccd killing protein)
MANLQVKNLPDDVHDKLRERARSRHMTMSALVGKLIEDELSSLTMDEWLDEVHKLPSHDPIDIEALMDEVKDEIEGR